MRTPICDFTRKYAESGHIRMHMPGHKGAEILGCEPYDITEIQGADSLFAPTGIIAESEANASAVFDCTTLYSTEGSSLCIRAMLWLAMQHAAEQGRTPVIAAARNAHKAFLSAAVLLGFEILWLPTVSGDCYLQGAVTPDVLADMYASAKEKPSALYITSPDYLGNMADISACAAFCHAHDMLLLCDNAHGAYLHFLPQSQHPAHLGADLCCDSAHKTLPVLTGGAYLHIADRAPDICKSHAKQALSLFASTSPSYLILQSLDRCNPLLTGEFPEKLQNTVSLVDACKQQLMQSGFFLCGDEPMKMTIRAKAYGYTGIDLADMLVRRGVVCEFADPDHLVLMPSPYQAAADIMQATDALCSVPQRDALPAQPPALPMPETVTTPREAMLANAVMLPLAQCIGKVCAELTLNCPPAVPIVVCGERITAETAAVMAYYGIAECAVLA